MRDDEFSRRKALNNSKKKDNETNLLKTKLLTIAAVLFTIAVLSLILSYILRENSFLTSKFFNSTSETIIKDSGNNNYLGNIKYPSNLTDKLVSKLKTVSDNSVVKIYIGHNNKFFDLIPLEMSKKDIIYMAKSDSSLSFDLAK